MSFLWLACCNSCCIGVHFVSEVKESGTPELSPGNHVTVEGQRGHSQDSVKKIARPIVRLQNVCTPVCTCTHEAFCPCESVLLCLTLNVLSSLTTSERLNLIQG